ncbi:calcium-transporting ATPase, putative [Plasmodium vivax]|uniref:P-type Ca(2+) transporter n=2 Tax=Plasmodium vivax TaxID=5855 RepID=A0A1G4H6X0_PLAVI|nr:calcium-transporting ATPase [Plasmodium vivax North Korean]SCO70630.1 calcium-transporting ATPase, putative [Plasmodium vivax]
MENVLRHAHVHGVEEVLRALEVDEARGLTKSQLAKRKELYGLNELEVETKKGILELILNQFEDLLVKILLLAAFISFALTLLDMQSHEVALCDFIEPLVIVMILILNAAVGVWQECNAEKSLEALKQLQPTKAKVLRDGKWEIIDSKYLTVGDIIELSVGNKTPADARIIKIFSTTIKVEQSMLTGESCSVDKYAERLDPTYKDCEIQLKKNILFSSTAIVAGRCIAVVTKIGMNTEIGQIQHAVIESTNEDTDTPLQIKIDAFGRQLSKIIFFICVTVWVINFKHFSDPIHGSFLYGCLYYFKISVALAVAAIPEGLPAVITTCLALGTRRMVKKNAIVRKLQSVETLGCTTVICSDKTGTLTTNQMTATVFHLFKEPTSLKEYQLCQKGETFFFYESCPAEEGHENDSFFNKLKREGRVSSQVASQASYEECGAVTSRGNRKHSSGRLSYGGRSGHPESGSGSGSGSDNYEEYPSGDETDQPLKQMHTNVNTIISRGSKILEDKIKKYAYSEHDYSFYMCMVNCNEANIFCNDRNEIVKVFGDSTELALLHFVHNFDIKPSAVRNNAMAAEYDRAASKGKAAKEGGKATSSGGGAISGDPSNGNTSSGDPPNGEEGGTHPSECISAWRNECQLIKIIEFTRERKLMSVIVENKKKDPILYCKGAPENIIKNCNYYLVKNEVKPLTEELKSLVYTRVKGMGKRALRTLSFAYRKMKKTDLNVTNAEGYFKLERDMIYLGGLGIIDPPRKYVGRAINLCHLAGIRVFMITGDNMDTAKAIAREINILRGDDMDEEADQPAASPNRRSGSGVSGGSGVDSVGSHNYKRKCCYSGREFEDFPLDVQKDILKNNQRIVFCRTEPKHKKQIVKILKDLGETVAMTGDGVNDAPALKSADIGISMGINGTEVAKEASDIVLADDNFNTIVEAIKEGRCIYNNMKAFIRYLISSNIGEVASIFLTALLGIPDSLAPVQLLWVNLVTDGLPATALGFNPPEHDVMKCKPRHKNDSLINGLTLLRYIVIGTYVGVATVSIFVYWYLFYPDLDGHTLVSFYQLSHYNQCKAWPDFQVNRVYAMSDDPCSYFSAGKLKASTLSLSVLVVIEMFNALNALSEYNSLFQIPPWRNMYLVLATIGSLLLHFMILYIPPLAKIFGVVALTPYDWLLVFMWSFPVIIIDEVIKFYAKRQLNRGLSPKQKID